MAKEIISGDPLILIYVGSPLEVFEQGVPEGLCERQILERCLTKRVLVPSLRMHTRQFLLVAQATEV